MDNQTSYTIGKDQDDKPRLKVSIEWHDKNGKYNIVETDDIDCAETIIGLLSGNICL